jgi:DNA-binding Xre family transcriptional regulator
MEKLVTSVCGRQSTVAVKYLRDICSVVVTAMRYEDEWKYVQGRITELRKARGLSIQALADYANIDRSGLSRLESGKNTTGIYFSTLCKIAEALEVPPGELVRR